MIGEIKANQQSASTIRNGNVQTKEKVAPLPSESEQEKKNVDTVALGSAQTPSALYTRPKTKGLNATEIDALKAEAEKATESLRELVRQMLLKQNEAAGKAAGKQRQDSVELKPAEEAALSLSEDGEFGVKAVSDRIVSFAIAVSGNDPTKLETLKKAIDRGFAEAEKAFGGKLPDISYATHAEVMRKLDAWSQDGEKV